MDGSPRWTIKPETAKKMASVCEKNQDKIYKKLSKEISLKKKHISEACYDARLTLELSGNTDKAYSKKGLEDLKKYIKTIESLELQKQKMMNQASGIYLINHIESYKNQDEIFHFLQGITYDLTKLKNLYIEAENKARKSKSKKGRPKFLKNLSLFIFECALLYEDSTGKKFTVDEYRIKGVPTPITEGQRFAHAALETIYSDYCGGSKFEKRYTESNFQNACVLALQELKKRRKQIDEIENKLFTRTKETKK